MSKPQIIFSHANSFPASTYQLLFSKLRSRGFQLAALEKFGHNPLYPVSNNWPHLVQELADFVSLEIKKTGEPAYLVGHSLGGFLSLMMAARHPELARAVVLIDSPIVGGWRATTLGVAKTTQLIGAVSPGSVSRRRRNHWPSVAAAFEHFRHKKAFAQWDAQVLQDYVEHATHEQDGQRVLSFDRTVETEIYNTLPDNMERWLKRHPLKCPVAFIGATHSQELKQVGMAMTEKIAKGRITMLDGSHLFPMERPAATAAAIEAALLNLQNQD